MYAEDSFFTLSASARAGLLALSAGFAGLAGALARAGLRAAGRRLAPRLAVALLVFWGFEWLSPQGYYAYYRAVIPGLPAQWVIGRPPGPGQVAEILGFAGPATLSAHARGLLGWALLLAACAPMLRRLRPPRSRH
ncbi:hypothetical protein LNKW23_03390 [Paralimibaculum aggregatum]|uniref:Uncharacterized protein n=1 Tax=Paralimibaculum aggregatum TaxID=3036245 RepID=A0ABQ6LHK5_9RHOB|nr:hypothetical protein [Limibaculum sp. NKW23]GMG81127.1 hypothetical protein LNKW23_03390 [Limibaculum sp. NKW23]